MARLVLIVLVIAVLVGGGWFFLNYEIRRDASGGWKIVPRKAAVANAGRGAGADPLPPAAPRSTIRIASFQLGRFDEAKLAAPQVAEVLVSLLSKFDLVAVQGVRGKNQGVLVHLIDQINAATGRTYEFATCPTQQRDALEHYSAFIFDCGTIEVDRSTVHFVEDPLGRLRIKPLTGSFRARGPDPAEAFTFTLLNVEVDADRAAVELDLLAKAYRAVQKSRPREDDVILLGDLESDDQHLGGLNRLFGVAPLLSSFATTVRGTQLLDNILLDRRATGEFTGRVEVVDMMREFHLAQPAAIEISEHLPIWAEFSVFEGGEAGHVLQNAN
jgi:deoxyribonuclease-1-like protein